MIRKLGPLALLLLAAAFAAGCGDDNTDSSNSDTPPAVSATVETMTTEDATTSEDVPTVEDPDLATNLAAGIAACKNSIDENPQVADDLKDDLKSICDKIGSESPEEIKQATRDVCEKIVEASVPEGDIRDQAKEACANAGG
jgi:hypothetical protein